MQSCVDGLNNALLCFAGRVSPQLRMVCQVRSASKSMLVGFFDNPEVVTFSGVLVATLDLTGEQKLTDLVRSHRACRSLTLLQSRTSR